MPTIFVLMQIKSWGAVRETSILTDLLGRLTCRGEAILRLGARTAMSACGGMNSALRSR